MLLTREKLKKILVDPQYITLQQLDEVCQESVSTKREISEVLIEKNFIPENHLGKLIAEEFGYKYIDLKEKALSDQIVKIIPELVAKNQKIIAFDRTKEGLKVAMVNPDNLEMINWLEKKVGEKIIPYYTTTNGIASAFKFYRQAIEKTFEEIIKSEAEKVGWGKTKEQDLPIIKIVDTLIEYAYQNRASDIHIEPLSKHIQVRFRIDGILHDVVTLPKNIHNLIVTRVKVLSRMRTDEHFAAQDGKFTSEIEGEKFDVRVSIIPVSGGENVVMRLLSEKSRKLSLEELGLGGNDFKKVKESIDKPYGMILATGPTGCGKTTTLYAILEILNKPTVHICTIEDPVEYDIAGISQIQVNPKTNLTFANGLRSIVRQDPDIIMVGEIRDQETAGIAVNSAMTGHLVLSTLHANNAATNIVRLMDMGIEPFLVASSINLIIAQRLVRKSCQKCRVSYEINREQLCQLNLSDNIINKILQDNVQKVRLYRGNGCKDCLGSGYSGRIGIFEVMEIDDQIRKLIMEKANADQIQAQAIKNNMTIMLKDGIEKMLTGITTIEEVIRVTRE